MPRQQVGLPRVAAAGGAGLVGRRRELGLVSAFLDRVRAEGDALLVVGEAGVGKSALLDTTERMASGAGFRVLRAGGTEFEMGLRFAALNQVLLPLREQFGRMSPARRGVLEVALGFRAGSPPDRLAVCNAVLELLGRATASRPVLMIVDDLPWVGSSARSGRVRRASSSGPACRSWRSGRWTSGRQPRCCAHGSRCWRGEHGSGCWRRRAGTRWPC
jgi:hypothetical protein